MTCKFRERCYEGQNLLYYRGVISKANCLNFYNSSQTEQSLCSTLFGQNKIKYFEQVELSDKEKEVIKLCARGLYSKQIAEMMYLSVGSVNNLIHTIIVKTNSSNKTEAVAKSICYGLFIK